MDNLRKHEINEIIHFNELNTYNSETLCTGTMSGMNAI